MWWSAEAGRRPSWSTASPATRPPGGWSWTAWSRASQLERILCPTLVIVPQADRIVGPHVGAEIAATIPDARFEALPVISHAVQFEAPDRVADLMRGFLA
jgi:pimeloyl-ACP methyl ester carboxylesterase